MKVSKENWGTLPSGQPVTAYTLENDMGMTVRVMDFGAAILNVNVPVENKTIDVLLGFDSIEGYLHNPSAHGGVVGRHANRIGDAKFVLNGTTYELEKNDGVNNLHSGESRWYERMWEATEGDDNENASVTFSLVSPHMDQGFPGEVSMSITYTLTNENALELHYYGTTTEDTIINMTNHSYFNLDGHDAGTIRNHMATICADYFTEIREGNIPTGNLVAVEGTVMDFNKERLIGQDIDSDYEPLKMAKGYDQNWVLRSTGEVELAATLYSPQTKILMEVLTDCPGIQMYTGNFLNDTGKGGAHYGQNSGVALETQYFPDAINHANFPQPVTKAGEEYDQVTVYRFSQR